MHLGQIVVSLSLGLSAGAALCALAARWATARPLDGRPSAGAGPNRTALRRRWPAVTRLAVVAAAGAGLIRQELWLVQAPTLVLTWVAWPVVVFAVAVGLVIGLAAGALLFWLGVRGILHVREPFVA